MDQQLDPVDAIVMTATVHHIPNRLELLAWVAKTLKPGGYCFIFEPTHYWPRFKDLIGKYVRLYWKNSHREKTENFSTHHFCTIEEFEAICKKVPTLEIASYSFHRMDFPRFTRKVLNRLLNLFGVRRDEKGEIYVENKKSVLRFFSQRMFVEFRKVS